MKLFSYLISITCFFSCHQNNNNLISSQNYFDKEQTKLESKGTIDTDTKQKEGVWKYYDRKGELIKEGIYQNDQQTGTWEYYSPLRQQGELINGRKEGIWKIFHNDGSISAIANYVNDKQEGECQAFYQNGRLSTESYYKDGELNGPYIVFSDKNTDTTLLLTYLDDKKNGLFKKYSNGTPYVIGHWKHEVGLVGEVFHYRNRKLIEIEYKDSTGRTISKESRH